MNIDFLDEPELEFGNGARHIDIRFGLMHHGPLDSSNALSQKPIHIGIVGTQETIDGLAGWIDRCRDGLDAKPSKQPNLFVRFPGFGEHEMLEADLVTDVSLQRVIREKDLAPLYDMKDENAVVTGATETFLSELESLTEKGAADVLVCATPFKLVQRMWEDEATVERPADSGEGGETEEAVNVRLDFHDLLKARAMRLGRPLQLVLPGTYDEKKRLKRKRGGFKDLQDEATRAWNFYVALYYKSGRTPWRLVRDSSQFTVCYVGVSFYKTLDGSSLMTSSAQVFNERGEGIVLRGGLAAISKEDRQVHLGEADATKLLRDALAAYRREHQTMPARVFLMKTSSFNDDELRGFGAALDAHAVAAADLVHVRSADTRLLRYGSYPPLRGTLLSKDDQRHVLYTRGGVDFYQTYPGMYVPRPLEFVLAQTESPYRRLAEEMLALTKMNWNTTQFDNADPIAVTAARNVGKILKNVPADHTPQSRYSYYI
jgi:hypothetical protein